MRDRVNRSYLNSERLREQESAPATAGRLSTAFNNRTLRSQQRSLRVGKSRRVTKIENKIVAASTRVGFPVDFESMVRRITHDSLIGPRGRENILVLRERE